MCWSPAVRASGEGERQLPHSANWKYRPTAAIGVGEKRSLNVRIQRPPNAVRCNEGLGVIAPNDLLPKTSTRWRRLQSRFRSPNVPYTDIRICRNCRYAVIFLRRAWIPSAGENLSPFLRRILADTFSLEFVKQVRSDTNHLNDAFDRRLTLARAWAWRVCIYTCMIRENLDVNRRRSAP